MITVYYTAVDGWKSTRHFKKIESARKFAHDYVGKTPTENGRTFK
jgi:hypothetical protein